MNRITYTDGAGVIKRRYLVLSRAALNIEEDRRHTRPPVIALGLIPATEKSGGHHATR